MVHVDRPIQRSFALGELDPELGARADLQRWPLSLSLCENCVTLPKGGATKRSGTMRIWEALANSTFLTFRYSRSDGYAIEAAAGVFRFFRDFGIVMNGEAPYTLATPFTADEVDRLYTTQSADEMFLATGSKPLQKMLRHGHTDWTLAPADIKAGPFLDENSDDGTYLFTNDHIELIKGTAFTLKANKDVFQPGHAGALFKIKVNDGGKYGSWAENTECTAGEIVRWGNNYYKYIAFHLSRCGYSPPVHTDGAAWDGSIVNGGGAVKWLYLHSGFGVVRVVSFTSAREVEVVAESYVPDEVYASGATYPDNGGTNRFAEGAWSAVRGFPKVVLIHQGRLLAFSSDALGSTWWASAFDDYENYQDGDKDTDAFTRTLEADDEVTEILWATTGKRLAIGTSGTEFVVQSSVSRQLLSPSNAYTDPATGEGSAPIKPIRVDQPIFVTKDRHRIMTIGLAANGEDYEAEDLTMFASHITETGVAGITWQRDPYRILWMWRTDGLLTGFTYCKAQAVQGWHRHPMSYQGVQAATAVPSSSGIRQDLWMIVERALPGGTRRYVECLMPFFETLPKADKKAENGWFVDCGAKVTGDGLTEIATGSDFDGADLWVLADGKFAKKTVADGSFTLDRPASSVVWGLPMTARIVTLPYDRNTDGGANSGRKQSVSAVAAKLRHSCLVNASADFDDDTEALLPTGGQVMGTAPVLYTGTLKAPIRGGWSTGGIVQIVSTGPFPMTVLSVTPTIQVVNS